MKVTGFTKRSLAERDAISYAFSGSLSNVTGSGVFGFSGDSGSGQFLFKEGKMYDLENRYFSSYQSGEVFSISGNISGSKYNYYLNEEPVVFIGSSPIGKINSFYSDATGCEIETSVAVKSSTFAYTLAFPATYRAGDNITGYISGNDSNYNFRIFSGAVESPDYWALTGFDTGDLTYSDIKLVNTGETSGVNGLKHPVDLILYTNLGNIQKSLSFTSTSNNPTGGALFSIEDSTSSTGTPEFQHTGNFGDMNSGTASLTYQIYLEEVQVTGDKPIKISLDDINTSGALNGYTVTGVQLHGQYKNGLYAGLPTITFSSTGAKDVQATATALTGEYMCADLYTGGPTSAPLWHVGAKFYTVTGVQLDSSGAYEDSTSISVSFSGGLYTGASFVGGYWYNGPSSEDNADPTCTGSRAYWYSSGSYSNIIDRHIKTNTTGAVALVTTGNVFSRTLTDTWNILTGDGQTSTGNSSLTSFNTGAPWATLTSTGSFPGTTITEVDKTSGNSYYDSGVTSKDNIKIEVWNQSAYRPISSSGAKTISRDDFYSYNYNPLTVNTGFTGGFGGSTLQGFPAQWAELKDLVTGTLETGGTGAITFTYSFIESGTTRDNVYTKFKTLEDTGNSVSFAQFTGEISSAFSEWKGLFETVYTGLTLNFVNNGLETGKVIWSDMHNTLYALPHASDSRVGDIRIGKVLLTNSSSISDVLEPTSGSLLGQSGNAGGDIVINSYNQNFRLDSQTSLTGTSYSIKYLFCQQIGRVLGVTTNDHADSILYNPRDGTNSIYTTWNFSDYFSSSLSGSRPDQDAVRYSYGGVNHLQLEQAKTKTGSTQDLYSATLNISGSGSQNISQIITGGAK
jgi:hypothetical protein